AWCSARSAAAASTAAAATARCRPATAAARCRCAVTARPAARSTTRSGYRSTIRTAARSTTGATTRSESEATAVQAPRLRFDHAIYQTELPREGVYPGRRTRRHLGTTEMRQEFLDVRYLHARRTWLGISQSQGQTRSRRLLRGRRWTQLP